MQLTSARVVRVAQAQREEVLAQPPTLLVFVARLVVGQAVLPA